MKKYYEFKFDETFTIDEEIAEILEKLDISVNEENKPHNYIELNDCLLEKKKLKMIYADCSFFDEDDFRVIVYSDDVKGKKKAKDRYISIMTEKYDSANRLFARRIEEMIDHIYG